MATEPLPDPCSWPAGNCCFTDEMQRLRAEVDAFREDAANYYRVAKEADAQQAALRARVAELESADRLRRADRAVRIDDDLAALTSLASMLDTLKSQDWSECWSEHDQQQRDWLTRAMTRLYAEREALRLSANKEGTPE